ncbi:hypothetical protein [Nocardiopsis sp. JB363]|uniref:hypothetical protein n=1 Tax=Nocardiopsis sp. JB363 TaxID=1434837 RepID=UPI00097B321C|nr:hypothetical protein [Nocardiopsis sp. JB363]SIO84625.1 hypothetical protein BQ8420_02855 [Nocardiopsis sp. JB363]
MTPMTKRYVASDGERLFVDGVRVTAVTAHRVLHEDHGLSDRDERIEVLASLKDHPEVDTDGTPLPYMPGGRPRHRLDEIAAAARLLYGKRATVTPAEKITHTEPAPVTGTVGWVHEDRHLTLSHTTDGREAVRFLIENVSTIEAAEEQTP